MGLIQQMQRLHISFTMYKEVANPLPLKLRKHRLEMVQAKVLLFLRRSSSDMGYRELYILANTPNDAHQQIEDRYMMWFQLHR